MSDERKRGGAASHRRVLVALLAAGWFGALDFPARAGGDEKPTLKDTTAPPVEEDDEDAIPVGDQPGGDTSLPVDKRPGMGGGTPIVKGGVVVTPEPAHLEGEYGGVSPGRAPANAKGTKKGKRQKPVVTWVGFQPLEGGSARVFAQMDGVAAGSSTFEQRVVGDELVVLIPKLALNQRNNARPLDAHFFDTRIAQVAAKKVAAKGRGRARTPAGVELRIKFKQGEPSQANGKIEQGQDGSTYLFLDFAP